MNYYKLVQLNKKQFERQCKIEGQEVYNYSKDTTEKVLFAKINNNKTSQDRTMIYYSADSSIKKGDIIYYKDYYYVIINENYHENEAWRKSSMIKCNTVWNIAGVKVPLVASDLSSPNPRNGSVVSVVNGNITFYTKDVEVLHTEIGVDDRFYDFGGHYTLVNKFFIDGLAYLYLQRNTGIASVSEVSLNFIGENSYNLNDGVQKLNFYVGCLKTDTTNDFYVPTAQITYTVDNPEVATIDENGNLTPLSGGTVMVTATAKGYLENGAEVTASDYYSLTNTQTIMIRTEEMGSVEFYNSSGSIKYDAVASQACYIRDDGSTSASKKFSFKVLNADKEEDTAVTDPEIKLDLLDTDANVVLSENVNDYFTIVYPVDEDIRMCSITLFETEGVQMLANILGDTTGYIENLIGYYVRVTLTFPEAIGSVAFELKDGI